MSGKNYVMNLEDFQQITPVFRTVWGTVLLKFLMKIVGIASINDLYAHSCDKKGSEFTSSLLRELQVNYIVDNREILDQLPSDGKFITISNHPYGALDGIILIDLIASIRPDYRVIVNKILENVESMADNFIGVIPPSGDSQNDKSSMLGLKVAMKHVKDGHSLGFFPSGAVAKYDWKLRVREQPWQQTVVRLIQQMKVPVVPIYFHGHNSSLYNLIGLISWRLRSLRLPKEMFNKKNKTIRVSVGKQITPGELARFSDVAGLTEFLRERTFEAGKYEQGEYCRK